MCWTYAKAPNTVIYTQKLTSVLLSSIFFIADSVVSGDLMIAKASSFSAGGLLQHDRDGTVSSFYSDAVCAQLCHVHTPCAAVAGPSCPCSNAGASRRADLPATCPVGTGRLSRSRFQLPAAAPPRHHQAYLLRELQ